MRVIYGEDGWLVGTVGADAYIGPCRVSGLSWRARWLREAVCTAAPKAPLCKGSCHGVSHD